MMETNELIKKIEEIEQIIPSDTNQWTYYVCHSFFITTVQFVKIYIGENTEFYKTLKDYIPAKGSGNPTDKAWVARKVLKGLKDYINLNLELYKTEQYNIKIDIMNSS